MSSSFHHQPVLPQQVLEALAELPDEGVLLDATVGGGGHSSLLLDVHPGWQLIGLDQDPAARAAAAQQLERFGERVQLVASNFAAYTPDQPVVAVLADLGVSSHQLDVPERGFSFRADGPLDMRMNTEGDGETAAALIDRLEENALADLLFHYGEERLSRRIARRLKTEGPWDDGERGTAALAYAIAGCYPPKQRHGRIHAATRSFQALRIAVNDELGVLETLLNDAPNWLEPGGRIAVISFHSLEDRLVKNRFKADERLRVISRKPLIASEQEAEANPRARSAKLRVAERLSAELEPAQ
ncbi:S-adenosyl-methyltransferase MraW [Synechococcus sp. RCC307]|uniref:Ribosomal RNA small subunit methyltransferase H n=1 Tax=Synechococcus sp. (strain RCC307) TaxID=316278 RepID=RSMH_SYNR3|nr:RecName: Full=Ribosomal RNA small subunit methyltransferase H; AltName: Full=16S rRNA m(4)C1402 methyltransferase; AltName: Full=rRNA (cytosine-N(4)-)-methyltransferase RsmH [Synechococcus sp. RCC307]CAK29161.1 S-adenosyl-methyltransferase MraW [Synechococcus sp. RCC307]